MRIIRNVRQGKVAYKRTERTESNNNDNCSLPPADHYDPTVIVCDQTIKLAVSDSKIVYLKRGGKWSLDQKGHQDNQMFLEYIQRVNFLSISLLLLIVHFFHSPHYWK